jgi:hypothetical protein
MNFIISKIETHFEMKQRRLEALRTAIWPNEHFRLVKYLTGKKGALETAARTKLPQADKHKDWIINIYLSRQKLESTIRYLEWYIHAQKERAKDPESKKSRKTNSYQERLPFFKEVLKLTDAFLNKGMDKEKYISKMSRTTKSKATVIKKKPKKESTIKDNPKAIETLFQVAMNNKVHKELEKQGIF